MLGRSPPPGDGIGIGIPNGFVPKKLKCNDSVPQSWYEFTHVDMLGTSLFRPGEPGALLLPVLRVVLAPRPNCIVLEPDGPLTSNVTWKYRIGFGNIIHMDRLCALRAQFHQQELCRAFHDP